MDKKMKHVHKTRVTWKLRIKRVTLPECSMSVHVQKKVGTIDNHGNTAR